MIDGSERFWMVKVAGPGATYVQHRSKHLAVAEAMRLARANPGTSFYVLEAIGVAKIFQPAQYDEFEPAPPF